MSAPRWVTLIPTAAVSFALGVCWNLLITILSGGRLIDALDLRLICVGGIAGLVAGWFTVANRRRPATSARRALTLDGVVIAYFIGLIVYWGVPLLVSQCIHLISGRGFFDVGDGFRILAIYLYGTVIFGLLLFPLCAASQWLTLLVFRRTQHLDQETHPASQHI